MRHGDLCSGIGGFALAARWLGWRTAFFAEIDPYCSAILDGHWPGVPNVGDLRTVDWSAVEPVDVITAGFPCQPVSQAGKREGLADERWLWPDVERSVRALRPRYVLLENTPGLFTTPGAFDAVLAGLAALRYDARWEVLSAAEVGAPHLRERVWIVAAPSPFPDALERELRQFRQRIGEQHAEPWAAVPRDDGEATADTSSGGRGELRNPAQQGACGHVDGGDEAASAHPDRSGREERRRGQPIRPEHHPAECVGEAATHASRDGRGRPRERVVGGSGRSDGAELERAQREKGGNAPDAEERAEWPGLREDKPSGERRGRPSDGSGEGDTLHAPEQRPELGWGQQLSGEGEAAGQLHLGTALADLRGGDDGVPGELDGPPSVFDHPWIKGVPPVAVGVKHRTHRLRALGNAIVPACAYPFLAAIDAAQRGVKGHGHRSVKALKGAK